MPSCPGVIVTVPVAVAAVVVYKVGTSVKMEWCLFLSPVINSKPVIGAVE
jgi:hypothetical protein